MLLGTGLYDARTIKLFHFALQVGHLRLLEATEWENEKYVHKTEEIHTDQTTLACRRKT